MTPPAPSARLRAGYDQIEAFGIVAYAVPAAIAIETERDEPLLPFPFDIACLLRKAKMTLRQFQADMAADLIVNEGDAVGEHESMKVQRPGGPVEAARAAGCGAAAAELSG